MLERVQKGPAPTVSQGDTAPHAHSRLEEQAPFTLDLRWTRGPILHYRIHTDQPYYQRARFPEDLLIEVSPYDPEKDVHGPLKTLCPEFYANKLYSHGSERTIY